MAHKRIISLILTAVLLFSVLPYQAFAAEEVSADAVVTEIEETEEADISVQPALEEETQIADEASAAESTVSEAFEDNVQKTQTDTPSGGEAVEVEFVCNAEGTEIYVWDDCRYYSPTEEGGRVYLLHPGMYDYSAYCDGYVGIDSYRFEVTDEPEHQTVCVELISSEDAFTVVFADPCIENQDFKEDFDSIGEYSSNMLMSASFAAPEYSDVASAGDAVKSHLLNSDNGYLITKLYGPKSSKSGSICSYVDNGAIILRYKSTEQPNKTRVDNLLGEIVDSAVIHTGSTHEGDYLYRARMVGCNGGCDSYTFDGTYYLWTLKLIPYMTSTVAQENTADACYRDVVNSLNLTSDLTTAQKVRKIYDWICTNIDYNYDCYNLEAYDADVHSAYRGIVEKNCVCQGFATVFYRLCLECGIDARSIGLGSGHEWNIVGIEGNYYFLDSTWDEDYESGIRHYFLRGKTWWSSKHSGYYPGNLSCVSAEIPCTDEYNVSASDYEWPESFQTFDITLDHNDGSGCTDVKTVTYNGTHGTMPTPIRIGYEFCGWYTSPKDGIRITSYSKVPVSDSYTLYAHWTPKEYTVTFDNNGGTGTTGSIKVVFDQKYGELPTPIRAQYTFEGWYTSETGGELITSETTVSIGDDHTLFAHWIMNSHYYVHFESNGGSGTMENQEFVYGEAQNLNKNQFTKTGYMFINWKCGNKTYGDGEIVSNLSNVPEGVVTLTAVWKPISYKIKYNPNGGNGSISTQKMTYDREDTLLPNRFTRAGYNFWGWSANINAIVPSFTDQEIVENLTDINNVTVSLYAIWQPYAEAIEIISDEVDVTSQRLEVEVFGNPIQLSAVATSSKSPVKPSQKVKWKSSNTNIATVDEDGLVTFLAPGSTKIIATATDGSKKSASVSFNASYFCTDDELVVEAEEDENIEIKHIDSNGNITAEKTKNYAVYIDAGTQTSFVIKASGKTSDGEYSLITSSKAVKYSSASTAVAAVKVNSDGSATVSVKSGASGACTINAVTTDSKKLCGSIAVFVRDYSPRIDVSSVVLDTIKTNETCFNIVSSYGNTIESKDNLRVFEYNSKTKEYVQSERIEIKNFDPQTGALLLSARNYIANGTIKVRFEADCDITGTETLDITLKIKNSNPTATIRQTKFNTFYTDSTSELTAEIMNETIESMTLEADCFEGVYNRDGKTMTISFAEGKASLSPSKTAKLFIWLSGYSEPIEKDITVSTASTKPVIVVSPSTVSINTTQEEQTAEFTVYDKTNGMYVTASQIISKPEWIDSITDGGNNSIVLVIGTFFKKSAKALLPVQCENWLAPVNVSLNVSTKSGTPTAKLGKTKLLLNKSLIGVTDETTITTNQSNMKCSSISSKLTAFPKGTGRTYAEDWFDLKYTNGNLTVSLSEEGETAAIEGEYTFTIIPYIGELQISSIKLSVNVTNQPPECSSSVVTLNKRLSEEVSTTVSTTNEFIIRGYRGFRPKNAGDDYEYTTSDGLLRLTYNPCDASELKIELTDLAKAQKTGIFSAELEPEVFSIYDEDENLLISKLTLKVRMIDAAVSATLSSSGKIDPISRGNGITYTVTKLSNTSESISRCEIAGDCAEMFELVDLGQNENNQAQYMLKLKESAENVSTATIYKPLLRFTLDSGDTFSKTLSIRPNQSKLQIGALGTSQIFYQSQSRNRWVTYTLVLSGPEEAEMDEIKIGNVSLFQKALVNVSENIVVTISADGKSATVKVLIKDASKLTAGKTYTLPLEITAEGAAANLAPTRINLSLKVKQ